MIVLYEGYGNHSNRLFQNIHFEAFCLEENIKYANPSFADMQNYYNDPANASIDRYAAFLNSSCGKVLRPLNIFNNVLYFDKSDKVNYQKLRERASKSGSAKLYVGGWNFRVHHLTKIYRDIFSKKYMVKESMYRDNDMYKEIAGMNNRERIAVVGVHIRRGDYKKFCGGKYYFDDTVYQRQMDLFAKEIHSTEKRECVFILFSSEPTSFRSRDGMYVSTNEWYIDHVLMGKCDYLIGPPSSFTQWASYIGKVKLLHVHESEQRPSIADFKICDG
jgi:hypothetical protein